MPKFDLFENAKERDRTGDNCDLCGREWVITSVDTGLHYCGHCDDHMMTSCYDARSEHKRTEAFLKWLSGMRNE